MENICLNSFVTFFPILVNTPYSLGSSTFLGRAIAKIGPLRHYKLPSSAGSNVCVFLATGLAGP
tara:strand:- start:21 stop:212 length:192 start_codon:yes stop_codon:yes gene_type:complete